MLVIKIGDETYKPSVEDLEAVRDAFVSNNIPLRTLQSMRFEEIQEDKGEYITLVCSEHPPTQDDIEAWKDILSGTDEDKEFFILDSGVEIKRYKFVAALNDKAYIVTK